jgi:hypothetical protein
VGGPVSAAELRQALRCDRPRCACRHARTVHCPNHPDRSPSFVVDQAGERLLVHCHGGCDQRAVIVALQARQLWPSSTKASLRKETESPLDQARREVLYEARRQQARRARYGELYAEADSIRVCDRVVREARAVAMVLGPREDVLDLLRQAAELDTMTRAAEARLDDDLMAGRL